MDLEQIRQDIAAFADDEQSVVIEKGEVLFERNRQLCSCRLVAFTGDQVDVEFNGARMPYTKFLAEELGRLSIMAEALRQKRPDVDPYIDTQADFDDSLQKRLQHQSALQTLRAQFNERIAGETKLIFLTGDAGEGKTALLRHLTRIIAEAYLLGRSPHLLFHIDTQGRSFVRLEEAVARDLGQLRIAGVFYPGIIRLVRHGLIVIAIDGFDELLAEIGYGEAYSGLGGFLRQLEGKGVVVAAARSAYFQVENYTAQTRLLASLPDTHVSVHQMILRSWTRAETVDFFRNFRAPNGNRIGDPEALYDELEALLGAGHVVLTRPFVVRRVAEMLSSYPAEAADLAKTIGATGVQVVPNVIHEFLKREVEEKWRDPNGDPYLTLEQHVHLLAAVAEEMWTQGTNALPVPIVELIAETVVDDLKLPQARKVQVVERVKAHALLPASTGSPDERAFDHEEFLNYFLAARIVEILKRDDAQGVQRFCELHSLPAVVGTWVSVIQSWSSADVRRIIAQLGQVSSSELRSTYLKQNAGLLASQLAISLKPGDTEGLRFDSMYFEGTLWARSRLFRAEFVKCTFLGIDLSGSGWTECHFTGCAIEGLALDRFTSLTGCTFDDASQVEGLLDMSSPESMRIYVPEVCKEALGRRGVTFLDAGPSAAGRTVRPIPDETRAALNKFLRIFSRNSGAPDTLIATKLGSSLHQFRGVVLPELRRAGIVREAEYRGKGQQNRYELNFPVELILKAENPSALLPSNLISFWERLRSS